MEELLRLFTLNIYIIRRVTKLIQIIDPSVAELKSGKFFFLLFFVSIKKIMEKFFVFFTPETTVKKKKNYTNYHQHENKGDLALKLCV